MTPSDDATKHTSPSDDLARPVGLRALAETAARPGTEQGLAFATYRRCRDHLRDHCLDLHNLEEAARAVVAGAEPMEHNGYKLPLFQGLIADQLEAIRG